jgi:hypothetical protein
LEQAEEVKVGACIASPLSTSFGVRSMLYGCAKLGAQLPTTNLTLEISLALELNIVRSIVAKVDLSISSWYYDSVERSERGRK